MQLRHWYSLQKQPDPEIRKRGRDVMAAEAYCVKWKRSTVSQAPESQYVCNKVHEPIHANVCGNKKGTK